jgi:hypothetical protein
MSPGRCPETMKVVSGQWSVVSEELRNNLPADHWPLTTDHFFLESK